MIAGAGVHTHTVYRCSGEFGSLVWGVLLLRCVFCVPLVPDVPLVGEGFRTVLVGG